MRHADDLSRPLGLSATMVKGSERSRSLAVGAAVTIVSAALFSAAALHLRKPPEAPVAVAEVTAAEPEPVIEIQPPPPDDTPVVRAGFPPNMVEVTGSLQNRTPAGLSAGLVETGRWGLLPRIASDGTRPGDAHARPIRPGLQSRPKIALVVGGLGLNDAVGREAVAKLPLDVTLAVAPYGTGLDSLADLLRRQGRELWLQVPMEPLDHPMTDLGPRTLVTTAGTPANIDKLHWSMSRFTGYAGVLNYRGERMLVHEPALEPVLAEIAARGLMFAEDGPPTRSLVPALSRKLGLPTVRSDLTIDPEDRPAAVDAALAKLEAIAKKRGVAVATATALPVTIERLAEWSSRLEAKGIALVPLSAVARR